MKRKPRNIHVSKWVDTRNQKNAAYFFKNELKAIIRGEKPGLSPAHKKLLVRYGLLNRACRGRFAMYSVSSKCFELLEEMRDE